jgi:transporter family-2 protein
MDMALYVVIALFNGMLIGLSRILNARLASRAGTIGGSAINHMVGFLFLIIAVSATVGFNSFQTMKMIPPQAFLGGILGAAFVSINSLIIPRLGAMKTILLVIAGQMIWGSFIDFQNGNIKSYGAQILGIGLILLGITINRISSMSIKRNE